MCGIVGAAGDLDYKDKDALQFLMHLCELRGEDSTGFFTVAKDNNEARISKVVGPTRYMFDTQYWDKLRTFSERVFVGHCRKATIGKISRSTAHPFNYDHITGVHNGTLRNWRYLLPKEEETDSMTLFKTMAERGVRDTIDRTDGAYALVWWDEKDSVLNFLRNKERPLHYAFSDDFKKIYWASEAWMLNIALGRAGIKVADMTPREKFFTPTLELEEDTWWRVKVGRRGDKDAFTFLQDHDETLKGGANPAKYQAVPFQGTYQAPFPVAKGGSSGSGQSGTAHQPAQQGTTQPAAGSTSTSPSPSATGTTVSTSTAKGSQVCRPTLSLVHDNKSGGSVASKPASQPLKDDKGREVVVGYNGLTLTKEEFETWVDPNCQWCQKPVDFQEVIETPEIIGDWIDDDHYICQKCINDTDYRMVGC